MRLMPFHSQRVQLKASITKLLSVLGAFFAFVFAVAIPSIYFATSIIATQQTLTVEAAFLARSVGNIIKARPDLWEFESVRLKELLSRSLTHEVAPETEIRTAAGKLVTKNDFTETRPIISVSAPFFDSGRLAGSIIIRHSIRTQIITTALLGILSSFFAGLFYYIFRTYPIRTLENTLTELQRSRDELEKRVEDRTEALRRINEELRTEISMREQIEEDLRKSEIKFRALFEKSVHGILVVDLETKRFVYANPSICRMLGYSETEFLQLGVADIHPKDSLDRVISEFELQRRGEKALASGLPCLRKDGTVFYADITASFVIISDRECVMGFFADVTDRKTLEDGLQKAYDDLKNLQTQLVQSGKLASIGELAAGVAHELNQPLMIIRTTAQLMLRKQPKNSLDTVKLLENLNSIEKNTKRMMNIINHLRTFSRQTKTDFTLVNVNEIIQNSFLMIGEQLSLKNIEVIKDFSNDIPTVMGDANQLEQVFLNLFANARDAIESKFEAHRGGAELQKKIVIATLVPGDVKDKIEILFKDTGSGMPQEALKNIYDPFYTTKEVGKGTGLGLSISYGIIQDHKGVLDVAETGPEGTTFRIRLPAA
jgi:PAS domain S-box-containing protein